MLLTLLAVSVTANWILSPGKMQISIKRMSGLQMSVSVPVKSHPPPALTTFICSFNYELKVQFLPVNLAHYLGSCKDFIPFASWYM